MCWQLSLGVPYGTPLEHNVGGVEPSGPEIAKIIYHDNFASLSVDGGEADVAMRLMLGHLDALGVVASREDDDAPVLGIDLVDGLVWKPTATKF